MAAALALLIAAMATMPAHSATASVGCVVTPDASLTNYAKPFSSEFAGYDMVATSRYLCDTDTYTTGHTGDDWDLKGDNTLNFGIFAVADGTIEASATDSKNSLGEHGCFGKYLRLKTTGSGVHTSYAHLDWKVSGSGGVVGAGQFIARAGASGTCPTGIHAHITQSKNWDGWYDPATKAFNPRLFLKRSGVWWNEKED